MDQESEEQESEEQPMPKEQPHSQALSSPRRKFSFSFFGERKEPGNEVAERSER